MFGRRRREDASAPVDDVVGERGQEAELDEHLDEDFDADFDGVDEDDESIDESSHDRVGGPWDSADAGRPTEAAQGWGLLDLGSLLLAVPTEAEVRMDVDEATQAVNAVAVLYADSVMQLMPYAGPRSSDIWSEVRGEIAGNVTSGGGTVDERQGPMGMELRAVVPAEQGERLPARFMGVDGPRWFLRAVVTGAGAHDDAAVEPMLDILRQVVVVRDQTARPVQEPLPVRLPQDASQVDVETEPEAVDLNPFKRGPEITEIH